MSQFVEINASKSLNNGAVNMHSEIFGARKTVIGRPTWRDQDSYQSRKFEPAQLEIPMTMMTLPFNRVSPSMETMKRKVVHYNLSRGDAIQLQTCKNAWVPSCQRARDTNSCQPLSEEDKHLEEIRKKFMSILNKITPENMTLLTGTIISLPIKTENCLKKVIELLFQKAIDEPNFTPQYAYICMAMHKKEIKPNEKRSETSFKNLLTKCCQDRVYEMHVHEETLAKSLKVIGGCPDQDVKEQLQTKYNQDEMIYRKRSVGNCRFMCELYNIEILTNKTLEASMKYLLKTPNEETLECACNILKHTGQKLSHKATFKKLKEYVSVEYKTKITTRIRFMIQDTIELKENNWVPRNARPKGQFNSTKTIQNTGKPVNKQYIPLATPVMLTKNTLQKPNEQKNTKLLTKIGKDDVRQYKELPKATEINDPKHLSIPIESSDSVKSNVSLLLPCVCPEIERSNDLPSMNDENIEIEEIQKKYRTVLNNITPNNVVPMVKNIISLPIKTDDCLKGVVELLFHKAMNEPTLIPQYAYICSLMKNMRVHSKDLKTNIQFRILMIALCQNAFESMFTRKRMVAKKRNEIESCKDKEIRKKLQSKFDKDEMDYRSRCVANCRFMCELLKVNILVPPVLEMCAAKLVLNPQDLLIECLCVILKHAGNALNYSGVFEKLHEYSTMHSQKLSSRIHSMILDTLKSKNIGLVERNTCEKSLLLDHTEENNYIESAVTDITQPLANEQPISTINITAEKEPRHNKPSREKQELNIYKTVKSLINSVTTENMNTTINELSALISNVDVMEKTVDIIFARANIRPESIPNLLTICSSLKSVVVNTPTQHVKFISFKKEVLTRCNQILHSGVQNDSIENRFTHKKSYTFVGELFNANMLSAHTLLEFLQIIPDKLTNRGLDNTCCLLKAAGKKLDQVYNLKKTIRKLKNMVANDVERMYSQRSSVLLKELVNLHDKKWLL